jgi:predicted nucleic acid-binding protein
MLTPVIPALRGKFILWFDAVSAAELRAGCRSRQEREGVRRLLSPFQAAERVGVPEGGDYARAATALSRLREDGKTLKQPGGALLDALIAAVGSRIGALVVTLNADDFRMLSTVLPLHAETMTDFMKRV